VIWFFQHFFKTLSLNFFDATTISYKNTRKIPFTRAGIQTTNFAASKVNCSLDLQCGAIVVRVLVNVTKQISLGLWHCRQGIFKVCFHESEVSFCA
jgi:uncharacterized cupin superfamily protein